MTILKNYYYFLIIYINFKKQLETVLGMTNILFKIHEKLSTLKFKDNSINELYQTYTC